MKIYAVRHGQTNYNVRNLCNNDPSKDVHLTELGLSQANSVAEKLDNHHKFEVIFISELPRTRQTAEIINRNHSVEVIVDSRINDRATGFDSKPASEFFVAVDAAPDPLAAKFNDGESFLEEKKRVFEFLDEVTSKDYKSILIVSHTEIMTIIYGYFHKLSDLDMWEMEEFANSEVVEFEV